MSFQEKLTEHRASLGKADLAIANELLSNPAEAPLWRGEEVAKRVDVHPAAATRFAQRLGYKGYIELRDELREEHNDSLTGAGDRFRRLLEESQGSAILSTLIDSELAAISAIAKHVTQLDLDQAAEILDSTRKIYLYAAGHATALVAMTARRFRRYGYTVVVLDGSPRDIAEALHSIGDGDVLLAFAFRKAPKNLEFVLQQARVAGANPILITDKLHTLENAPTLTLSAPRGQHEGFASLSVPMTIINAMILTLSRRNPELLDQLDSLQQILDGIE